MIVGFANVRVVSLAAPVMDASGGWLPREAAAHGQVVDHGDHVRQMVEVWESIRGEAVFQQQFSPDSGMAETWTDRAHGGARAPVATAAAALA
jgi:hypothetical protein